MSLQVTVKSASNLPNVERWSKSDPITVLTFQGGHLLVLVCSVCRTSSRKRIVLTSALVALYNSLCVFLYAGEKKKTKVIDNNLDPEWNEVRNKSFNG